VEHRHALDAEPVAGPGEVLVIEKATVGVDVERAEPARRRETVVEALDAATKEG
jgi:hypothetical protein